MAQFTMTIPDTLIADLLDAFDSQYGGRDEEGGETKAQWARKQLRRYVREVYRAYKAVLAAEEARLAAAAQADDDSDPIEVN